MRTHSFTTEWEFEPTGDDGGWRKVRLEVEFEYECETRALAPSLNHAGEPGEGEHIGIYAVNMIEPDGTRSPVTAEVLQELSTDPTLRAQCLSYGREA